MEVKMKRVFILKGLDCPNCSAKIEKEVGALPGVESSVVNLMQQTLTVQSEKSADATLAEPFRKSCFIKTFYNRLSFYTCNLFIRVNLRNRF